MSPEQARGKAADKRADIWAFGVVLCEMLTGRPLYTGDTAAEILACVIEREPDVSALPAATPASDPCTDRPLSDEGSAQPPSGHRRGAHRHRARHRAIRPAPEPQQRAHGLVVRFDSGAVLRWAAIITAALGSGSVVGAVANAVPAALIRVNAELGVDASLTGSQGDVVALVTRRLDDRVRRSDKCAGTGATLCPPPQ